MNRLYFLQLDDTVFSKDDENLYDLISPEKKLRIKKYFFDIDKKLCLYADLLARILACEIGNLSNHDLLFSENSFGKPFVTNIPNFKYNFSHTKNAIALGISNNEIGIDIEKIRDIDITLAKRFFTRHEYNYVTEKQTQLRFLEVWTKKEAYLKFIGKGLSVTLNSFSVFDVDAVIFSNFQIGDYIVSVCAEKMFFENDITVINQQQLLSYIPALKSKRADC
jgi:4'-phosphopantetheinyl transferase